MIMKYEPNDEEYRLPKRRNGKRPSWINCSIIVNFSISTTISFWLILNVRVVLTLTNVIANTNNVIPMFAYCPRFNLCTAEHTAAHVVFNDQKNKRHLLRVCEELNVPKYKILQPRHVAYHVF